jgi:hypothetical protein
MIPCLGAIAPESIMPFPLVAAPSVSAEGVTDLAIPAWVRNVGRYSLLVKVVGGWGQSMEDAAVLVLNGSGTAVLSLVEGSAISPSPVQAEFWNYFGHTTGATVFPDMAQTVPNGTWIAIEGLSGAAAVRLVGSPPASGNPTTFSGLSVLGLGRGRRDPTNLAALIAAIAAGDSVFRIVMS